MTLNRISLRRRERERISRCLLKMQRETLSRGKGASSSRSSARKILFTRITSDVETERNGVIGL